MKSSEPTLDLTLRDYFAASALSKLKWAGGATAQTLAEKAYELADAMIAAGRAKITGWQAEEQECAEGMREIVMLLGGSDPSGGEGTSAAEVVEMVRAAITPKPAPAPPPIDNAFVTEGCEKFGG